MTLDVEHGFKIARFCQDGEWQRHYCHLIPKADSTEPLSTVHDCSTVAPRLAQIYPAAAFLPRAS
eukprot:651056-Prorocentrum_minimum.AAC.3